MQQRKPQQASWLMFGIIIPNVLKINCKKEKAEGNESKPHTILYVVDKIVHVGNNRFPRGEQ